MSDVKWHKKSGECVRNLKLWVPGSGTNRVSKIRGCLPPMLTHPMPSSINMLQMESRPRRRGLFKTYVTFTPENYHKI